MTGLPGRMRELWWQTQMRSGDDGERHATWLELFYDLVFVIAIAELGHNLSVDLSLIGLLEFGGLFIPIWWLWLNHALYADRFDTDDAGFRFLTVVQMFAVVAMTANVHGALEETYREFALSMVGFRLVMIVMYSRTRHINVARPLSNRVMAASLIGGSLWLASVFVPTPWAFALWILALILELGIGYLPSTRRAYALIPVSESHLPERFGLFTIIVLGESVARVVKGLVGQELRSLTTVVGALGLLTAFGLW